MQNLEVTDQKKQLLKARSKESVLSSFNSYNKNSVPFNLTCVVKMILQKSDKGNSIGIIDKDGYSQNMGNILSDSSKFSEIRIANEKYLNFLINKEKEITDPLKQLNDSQVISDRKYENLKLRGSRFGILCNLCEILKSLIDNCLSFRAFLSAIKFPYHNIAKHLVTILEPITTNKFIIKNSFEFTKEVIE